MRIVTEYYIYIWYTYCSGGEGKSKLETATREQPLLFIKKQQVLVKKYQSRNDGMDDLDSVQVEKNWELKANMQWLD